MHTPIIIIVFVCGMYPLIFVVPSSRVDFVPVRMHNWNWAAGRKICFVPVIFSIVLWYVMVPRVDSVLDANTNLELRILNANMNMMFDELWIDNQTMTTYPFLHKKI
jgi:hypothetical protein